MSKKTLIDVDTGSFLRQGSPYDLGKIRIVISREVYQASSGITEFLERRDEDEIIFIVLHFKCESLPRRILEFAGENYLCLDQV